MTTFESRIRVDFNRGFFDSVETDILSAAFERAWAFVGSDPGLEGLEVSKRQSELARCLMALEKLGETNPTSLANAAIRMLHQRHAGKRFLNHRDRAEKMARKLTPLYDQNRQPKPRTYRSDPPRLPAGAILQTRGETRALIVVTGAASNGT
jgi:hypothetical protein